MTKITLSWKVFTHLCVVVMAVWSCTPSNSTAQNADVPLKTIRSKESLNKNEGVPILLQGTYSHPNNREAFAQRKIVLQDGTKVIIAENGITILSKYFTTHNDQREMSIHGTVFQKQIPENYQIIGRTDAPYLLEITKVEVAKL